MGADGSERRVRQRSGQRANDEIGRTSDMEDVLVAVLQGGELIFDFAGTLYTKFRSDESADDQRDRQDAEDAHCAGDDASRESYTAMAWGDWTRFTESDDSVSYGLLSLFAAATVRRDAVAAGRTDSGPYQAYLTKPCYQLL